MLTKDELEIEELKESQSSSLSRVISNQSARTCSTLSTKVYDTYIDLTKEPEEPMPALADYSSDDDDVIPVAATVYIMEHISNLNHKSGDDQKSTTTGENSKIADVISTSQCL